MVIYLLALLGIATFVFDVWQQVRPWTPPIKTSERLARSFSTGAGTVISLFCLFAVLDLRSKPEALDSWHLKNVLALVCFMLPFGVMAFAGSYINFGIMDKIKHQAEKVKFKT
jgi:hypothetical protein